MNPNRSKRRVHSSDFKAQVLGECRQPGASVAAVAIGHGLNPNVVRKWLAGQNLKRMSAEIPVTSLSLILCARHTMTHRSMYAKQEEAAGRVAGHPH